MMAVAIAIFLILTPVAGLHLYWAFGGVWPAKTAEGLANMVVGDRNKTQMPGAVLTVLVSAMIFGAGLTPLVHVWGILPDITSRTALWLLVLVFFGRGMVTYLLPGLAAKPAEPFRTLNYRYYSPLCLALGAGYLMILLGT